MAKGIVQTRQKCKRMAKNWMKHNQKKANQLHRVQRKTRGESEKDASAFSIKHGVGKPMARDKRMAKYFRRKRIDFTKGFSLKRIDFSKAFSIKKLNKEGVVKVKRKF